MKNLLLSPLSRFLAVFMMIQMTVMPLKADWYYHRPAPVVVYHQPAPVVVYHETSDAEVILGACVVGAGVGALIGGIFSGNSEKRKFREYTDIFRNLGYTRAEAEVYAKLAVENPGGYKAVVENIEREKELKYKRDTEQRLMQQQIRGEQELSRLKHQQKIQELDHQQQSQNDNYQKTALVLLIILLSIGAVFMGVVLAQRLKRNS